MGGFGPRPDGDLRRGLVVSTRSVGCDLILAVIDLDNLAHPPIVVVAPHLDGVQPRTRGFLRRIRTFPRGGRNAWAFRPNETGQAEARTPAPNGLGPPGHTGTGGA